MREIASWKTALVAVALTTGCGGPEVDEPDTTTLPVLTTGSAIDPTSGTPDLACLGSRTQPVAGDSVDAEFELLDFETSAPVSATRVWFFRDNEIRDACEAPACTELTTDPNGVAPVTMPTDGWYAYRVFPRTGGSAAMSVIDSIQYNEPGPSAAGQRVSGSSVSEGTLALIPAVVNISRVPGTALLAGIVQDCIGTPVYGAIVRVFDGDTEIGEGELESEPHYRYFNGNEFPSDTGEHTHADGLYVGIQIPVPASPDARLRVEAWGRATEDDAPVRLGCEAVRVLANAVTIINIGPTRRDYPAGHPCADGA